MQIAEGKENIACVQLTENGIYRWHTRCCDMPVANTMNSSKYPFVGVSVKFMRFISEQEKAEMLGPVTMKGFGKYSIGDMPKDAHPSFLISFLPKVFFFMLKGMVLGKGNPSPFFDSKEPVVKVTSLS